MQPAVVPAAETVKEQVVDRVPKRIKELRFGLLSKQDITKQAVIEVCDKVLFDLDRNRAPRPNGPLDSRMGIAQKNRQCETCGETYNHCNGHFGFVKLALPAFHVGYFKRTIMILNQICKECATVLLPEEHRRNYLRELRKPNLDNLRRMQICKKVLELCKKVKECPLCGSINGVVKKAGTHPLKIIHDKYRDFNKSTSAKKVAPKSKIVFDRSFATAKKTNSEIEKHVRKAMDDLNPLRVLNLFQRISPLDCELLGMDPNDGRPENLIWEYVPAPPLPIRPSVAQDLASTEDDITQKLSEIVNVSTLIREGLARGSPTAQIMEQWDFLQIQIGLFVNSDVPGLQQAGFSKTIRGFCQRLKGKQGRFRGNLSGKRVNFSARTVISPDPNLGVDQVAIPELVAKRLTYPERVTRHNIWKLRQVVANGPDIYPGAIKVIKTIGTNEYGQILLKYRKPDTARKLQIGDVVERHLEDGDIVLFNRQPSLHKLSILSHFIKVRPHRTFRLNECVCTPYNADFDGDEMNLHVPQTEEARTEAVELMGVKHNLVTPKNGEPIISAIQDFVTAGYLISSKDNFYDRKTFANICVYMGDGDAQLDLPPPTVMKPVMLWTGKQIFNVLMRPNKKSNVLVNLDAACREYRPVTGQHHDLDKNDGWLCIRNSEVMCGVMDKSTIGSGKKSSLFYVVLRDFGPEAAVLAMNRLAKLAARWLTNQGFSIGINDVYPGDKLLDLKAKLVETAYAQCDNLIEQFRLGELTKAPGCDEAQTLENLITGILNKVRNKAGDFCITELSRWNAALIMAVCGSKGSYINVSQMVAVVGQQSIGGKRVEDGFQDRSLPHFPKHARQPLSKGFVRNSFFSGLSPSEFIFHAMSGREGLVDTAVKTAETGYMSRRLMKSLEDLSSKYDDTVRNSSSSVIQFKYGDDKLDPVDMEGSAGKPVNFERTYIHSETTSWDNDEDGLLPWEFNALCEDLLAPQRAKLQRHSLDGSLLDYGSTDASMTDQLESAREFLSSIQEYIDGKASSHAVLRKKLGLPAGLAPDQKPKKTSPQARNKSKQVEAATARIIKLSPSTLRTFVAACLSKYKKAQIEPGHAVGAVGAQSIGEPGTQMTLKTFHFAGVAGMSITEGVPRIKEIINASREISTPVITCDLLSKQEITAARIVKGRIEKTYIKDVIYYCELEWSDNTTYIKLRLDYETIDKLQLNITPNDVVNAIVREKKLKIELADIDVEGQKVIVGIEHHPIPKLSKARPKEEQSLFQRMESLCRAIPNLVVRGYRDANRAVISMDANKNNQILVEGYGLRACMATEGVDYTTTKTNSVIETREVLGIEAARKTIINEIGAVMRDMDIDPRHMQLLADVMTHRGEVLGITRFGLSKMRDSVLQLASFEKTQDHLFEAAAHLKSDKIEGVSECIIMGQSMNIGTGAFKLIRELDLTEDDLRKKETVFEDCWRQISANRDVKRGR